MPILVMSIDFDGCLAHQNFTESDDLDLIKFNQPFLHHLKNIGQEFEQQFLMLGSSRQSSFIDFMSQKGNQQLLRCFPYYLQIANYLGIDFVPFLMADLYSNLAPGTAFNLELALNYPFRDKDNFSAFYMKMLEFQGNLRRPLPPDAFCDISKMSLLYAQMHLMAIKYPSSSLVFKFFDDDLQHLNKIYAIFSKYPALLPEYLRFELCHYNGQEMKDLFCVLGCGQIDNDYYQTLIDLKNSAHLSTWENRQDLSFYFNQNLVDEVDLRLAEETETRTAHHQESRLIDCLIELYCKAKNLEKRQEGQAAQVAFDLHRDLSHLLYQFQHAKISLADFTAAYQAKIDEAKPVLAQHRGWKEILTNLVAAILMFAGLGYLLTAAMKRDLLLFKVKTDSVQKLENIEQELVNIKAEFEGC